MIEKKDNLGRIIYCKYNDVERFIYKYYDDTKVLKLKISLIMNEQVLELFNKKQELIFLEEKIGLNINLSKIKIYNNKIKIILPLDIKNNYIQTLRENIKKTNRKHESRASR